MTKGQIESILTNAKIGHVQVIETGLQRCPLQVKLVVQPGESQQDQFDRLDAIESVLERAGVRVWAKADCVSVHGWLPTLEDEEDQEDQ